MIRPIRESLTDSDFSGPALTLYFLVQTRIFFHAPTIFFVFSMFAGDNGSSPGSNGCVLNHAPRSPNCLMVASSARWPCSMDFTPASSVRGDGSASAGRKIELTSRVKHCRIFGVRPSVSISMSPQATTRQLSRLNQYILKPHHEPPPSSPSCEHDHDGDGHHCGG
jgi:hypothetical protein